MMGLATGRRAETELLTRGLGRYFPYEWARFRDHLQPEDRDGDLAAGYARILTSPDPGVHLPAADAWCRWEDALGPESPRFPNEPPAYRLAFARLVTHYWSHGSWLEDGEVIVNAGRLAGIPGVLVQGTLDLGNLIGTPWALAAAWPGVELRMVDAAHETRSAAMIDGLVEATNRFANRVDGHR